MVIELRKGLFLSLLLHFVRKLIGEWVFTIDGKVVVDLIGFICLRVLCFLLGLSFLMGEVERGAEKV